jgi:hypothetical protein
MSKKEEKEQFVKAMGALYARNPRKYNEVLGVARALFARRHKRPRTRAEREMNDRIVAKVRPVDRRRADRLLAEVA